MTCERSVILYRAVNPFWLTDASISHDGALVITSGTASNEYWLIVAADRKCSLLNTLLGGVPPSRPANASLDKQLLAALAAKFASEYNPFADIEAYLCATDNTPRRDVWLADGS